MLSNCGVLAWEGWDFRIEAEQIGHFKPYIVVKEGSITEAKYAPETLLNDHWNLILISRVLLSELAIAEQRH